MGPNAHHYEVSFTQDGKQHKTPIGYECCACPEAAMYGVEEDRVSKWFCPECWLKRVEQRGNMWGL